MNKKQLIVAWVIALSIVFIILSAPKMYLMSTQQGGCWTQLKDDTFITSPQWNIVIQRSLIVLIIGGLLIYTLRDKKK